MKTDKPVKTYEQLLDRVISDGISEVAATCADLKDQHKRDGAIEGFEACRGQSPDELVKLWLATEEEISRMRMIPDTDAKLYWRQRYKALQIEWVCNVISVGLTQNGHHPLLGHLPTARGAMKYAQIVGVREPGLSV
jgi:hypothetical protein